LKIWRIPGSVVVALVVARAGWAETYPLAETVQAADHFQVHLDMTVAGEIRANKDGKPNPLKLTATVTHEFPERVLTVSPKGVPEKVARYYETAKAVISLGGDRSERALRPERRLLVAQRHQDDSLVYCPAGTLTREELELTTEHFDTLALTGLLPGKAVAVGESWPVANATAQALCHFEGLTA